MAMPTISALMRCNILLIITLMKLTREKHLKVQIVYLMLWLQASVGFSECVHSSRAWS